MMRAPPLALACLLACACETTPGLELPDELVGETRDLQVYRHESGPEVCGGQFARWQSHAEAIGAFFGSDEPFGPFPMIITDMSAADLYCENDLAGCASYRPSFAVGNPWALPHEIAHLVDFVRTGSLKLPFWREGFAEAWSDRGSMLPIHPAVDDLLTDSAREIDYAGASHFVQWLADAYGADRVVALFRRSDSDDRPAQRLEQLEEILGEPYAAIQERFWREAPLYYPGFGRCGATDHVLAAGGRLELGVRLDCAVDPGPLEKWPGAPERAAYTTRIVAVEQSGRYDVIAAPGHFLLLPCDSSDDPLQAAGWLDDERDVYSSGPTARSKTYGLPAGRYKLWLVSTRDEPVYVRAVIQPAQPFTVYTR